LLTSDFFRFPFGGCNSYLAKERTNFNPKKVVELGSGNGLLGMVCAVLFGA